MSEIDDKENYLLTTWYGVFIIRDEKIIEKRLFPKNPDVISKKRMMIKQGLILPEEKELAEIFRGNICVTTKRLARLGEFKENIELDKTLLNDLSFDDDILREALLIQGEKELKDSVDTDKHLGRAVETIRDLNETINILTERLRDWYSLHYPELEEDTNSKKFVELIAEFGDRESIVENTNIDGNTVGKNITENEKELYKRLAKEVKSMMDFKEMLTGYVEKSIKETAPSLTKLTGPKLGGELISHAGSLKKLASMPASTIQVLGAEKSLFRHLERGTDPPKHGYILQHPIVHGAAPNKRGKVARTFANKIAIAARVDYFGNRDIGDRLREELESRLANLK